METPECSSVNKCIKKFWWTHRNIFQPLKKGRSSPLQQHGEPGGLYAKWNKPNTKGKKKTAWSHLYVESNSIELTSFLIEEI